MNRKNRIIPALLMCAVLTFAFPAAVLAEGPSFAHDEATWERLRDNVMEYDEIQMLVEEYNPTYLSNYASYMDSKSKTDAEELRDERWQSAMDLQDSAEELRDQAEDIRASLEDQAAEVAGLPLEDPAVQRQVSAGVSSLSSAYASLLAAAGRMSASAVQSRQTADTAYEDEETRKLNFMLTQNRIVTQTQALFASYNQVRKTITTLKKNLEYAEAQAERVNARAAGGMATQADILNARANVENLRANIASTEASAEQIRRQLMLATGWKADGNPEIRDIPVPDPARIDAMNPDADTETALEANISLKLDRKTLSNMNPETTDYKNQERTAANEEQNIRVSMKNLYNDVIQKKYAWQAAEAALATETQNLLAAQQKYAVGTISRFELLSAENSFAAKQIDRETAGMNLQQAVEKYEWALKGYL